MARSDLLVSLVDAGARSDDAAFRRTAEALIADERAKQHHVLADRLDRSLSSVGRTGGGPRLPGPSNLVVERVPHRTLSELYLADDARQVVLDVVAEQSNHELLRAHGLEPRNRILLVGPPGNGKTSTAEALAEALSLPFLVVRYDTVIGSYLGETAARLRQVFEYAKTREAVLFFDEFDTLGKERADPHDTGEVKRVVSSLLLQIDDLPSYVIVVTATNHPEILDRAVWRRFEAIVYLDPPSDEVIRTWVADLSSRKRHDLTPIAQEIVSLFHGRSYADLEMFADDLSRQVVLTAATDVDDRTFRSIAMRRIRLLRSRYDRYDPPR